MEMTTEISRLFTPYAIMLTAFRNFTIFDIHFKKSEVFILAQITNYNLLASLFMFPYL